MGADQHIDWNASVASTLDWWVEAGVDTEVADAPRDWLARPAAATATTVPVAEEALPPAALPATVEAFATWRIGDEAPDASWGAVRLGAEGPATAGLMVLIEMPERDDAGAGQLLSGQCGRLFDRMLAAIGYDRASVHLAAMTTVRPASGRVAADAVERLAEVARHQVGLVAPKRLLLLGNAPARALLDCDCAKARGILHGVNHDGATKAVASFHPRMLLDTPAAKAEAWKDLQLLISKAAA